MEDKSLRIKLEDQLNPEWTKKWMHDAMYRGPSPYNYYPYGPSTPNDVPTEEDCPSRLPCGICRLTNMPCPKMKKEYITWISNKSTSPYQDNLNHSESNFKKEGTLPPTEEYFIITTDYEYKCNTLNEVEDKMKEVSSPYIIRYYKYGVFQGGFNLEELQKEVKGDF